MHIDDPPAHLWRRGEVPRLFKKQKVVSIVGARRCTPYGEKIAYENAVDKVWELEGYLLAEDRYREKVNV